MCYALIIFFLVVVQYCNSWPFTDVYLLELQAQNDINSDDVDDSINNFIDEDIAQQRINLIYPGTKWCGAGNIADNDDDLGTAVETDKCCRQHDMCPDIIEAGQTKYNLTNDSFYTKLSCECDETFRKCLHDSNTKVSNQVGVLYFNALGTKCYKKSYPIVGCKKKGGWFNKKCLEYDYDTNGNMTYQWHDEPNYRTQ